jgi:hypothetical protein
MAMAIAELVDQALEHGSLFNLGHGRTITVEGKRRGLIRVQCDIFGSVMSRGDVQLNYPELAPAIDAAVDAWRASNLPRRP